jgi:hypothetical protein
MSDSQAPVLTPEQEARVQELIRAMLPEIIQTVFQAMLRSIRDVTAMQGM